MARHLIHIGFPKAGSTTLQDWFVHHPEMASVHNGIAGAYDAIDLARRTSRARTQPRWRVTSSELFTYPAVEPGPDDRSDVSISDRQDRICEMLHELFPRSSILIVTRGFRAVLYSAYSEYVRVGGSLGMDGIFRDHLRGLEEAWDYDRIVALYGAAFGEDRVCVLPYEQLRDDPVSFTRNIETFLCLEPADVPLGRLNPSLSPMELLWYPRLTRIVDLATRRRPGLRARYRRRIGHPVLRPLFDRLPGHAVVPEALAPEIFERCYAHACELRKRPAYGPWQVEYGGCAPEETGRAPRKEHSSSSLGLSHAWGAFGDR